MAPYVIIKVSPSGSPLSVDDTSIVAFRPIKSVKFLKRNLYQFRYFFSKSYFYQNNTTDMIEVVDFFQMDYLYLEISDRFIIIIKKLPRS